MHPISGIKRDCPIQKGTVVPYGWRRLFWRTVDYVGEPLLVGEDWIVPVLYRSSCYGLVRYKKGLGGALSFDEISDIRPGKLFMRALLRMSVSMPQILPVEDDGALRLSVEEYDPDEETEGPVQKKLVYTLCLYGVLGSRNGRTDTVQLYKISVPREVAHLWA